MGSERVQYCNVCIVAGAKCGSQSLSFFSFHSDRHSKDERKNENKTEKLISNNKKRHVVSYVYPVIALNIVRVLLINLNGASLSIWFWVDTVIAFICLYHINININIVCLCPCFFLLLLWIVRRRRPFRKEQYHLRSFNTSSESSTISSNCANKFSEEIKRFVRLNKPFHTVSLLQLVSL